MTLLLENPLPIWAAGIVLTLLCVVVLMSRRTLGALLALVGVVLATVVLLVIERIVVTDREQVEIAVAEIMEAIQANDLDAVLAFIDSEATVVRRDAETLMPQVTVRDTGAASLQVELDRSAEPLRAVAKFRGRVDVVHQRSGQRVFYFDDVEVAWVKRGEAWQIVDYTVMYRGEPISAVDSVRGSRPVPSR